MIAAILIRKNILTATDSDKLGLSFNNIELDIVIMNGCGFGSPCQSTVAISTTYLLRRSLVFYRIFSILHVFQIKLNSSQL